MLTMTNYLGTVARMGGIPAILSEFVDSFTDMMQWNAQFLVQPGEHIYYPPPPKCSVHDLSRNMLAESFRGDWLLQLDSDHEFEPDLVGRLLNIAEQTKADVVVGMYQFRMHPHSPVLYRRLEDGFYPLVEWDRRATAMIVDSAGGGCLLARRKVFDRIRNELGEKPFARYEELSEDHSFFLRLRKLEIPVVCAPKVECHHLQVKPVSLSDYDRAWINTVRQVDSKVMGGAPDVPNPVGVAADLRSIR